MAHPSGWAFFIPFYKGRLAIPRNYIGKTHLNSSFSDFYKNNGYLPIPTSLRAYKRKKRQAFRLAFFDF